MDIFNPSSPAHFADRNRLLQSTMRPQSPLFSIASEYPIVLAEEHPDYSWCLEDREQIVAHLNLWPRTLVDSSNQLTYKVGLIGNVATDPSRQGQGIMRTLMSKAAHVAKDSGFDALILWSDLLEFYQKLGFESVGEEHRTTLSFNTLKHFYSGKFSPKNPEELSDSDLGVLLQLRPDGKPTLARSINEFRRLLSIPYTSLFTCEDAGGGGYGIIGKGYDMVGVVHEWGMPPDQLPYLCADMAVHLGLSQLMLLSPTNFPIQDFAHLSASEALLERHPMALAACLSERADVKKALQNCFIWGLDSI